MDILINTQNLELSPQNYASVSQRRSLFIICLFLLIAGGVFIIYYGLSLSNGQGAPIMPLDDVYIHFQYAHQLAEGQPYRYNPGLPPTSGATSFLYPFMLAVGDLLGFRGLPLGTWAMILGALALGTATILIYKTALGLGLPLGLSVLVAIVFEVSGAVTWHAMSGMETLWVVVFLFLALYGLLLRKRTSALIGAALSALIRPEGALIAVAVCAVLSIEYLLQVRIQHPRAKWSQHIRHLGVTLLPILMIVLQPLVNRLVTGSSVASGNSAKSLFGVIPTDWSMILMRILENFLRMLRELFDMGGTNPVYIGLPVAVLGLMGLVLLLVQRGKRLRGLAIIAVFLGGFAAISTLDTAFWHFKRYQIPFMGLLFLTSTVALVWLYQRWKWSAVFAGLSIFVLLPLNVTDFLHSYLLNTGYVVAQPLQMARWLATHAETDAVVAVHDVGMMRYQGGRTTLDIVGLTTPSAADYWRNGPGSVGEFLDRERPDLIASYGVGHGYGLGFLENTALFAQTLARFQVTLDPTRNVALASDTQGIYAPDYALADASNQLYVIPERTDYLMGMRLVGILDVADILSEREYHYRWTVDGALEGFPTEYQQFNTLGCPLSSCELMEGGRHITGIEEFTLNTHAGEDLILVTRVHPQVSGTIAVYANDQLMARRVIPSVAGSWLEIPTWISADMLSEILTIRIETETEGDFYRPYSHFIYQGVLVNTTPQETAWVTFQEGAIGMTTPEMIERVEDDQRYLDLSWDWLSDGNATGDYAIFLHFVGEDGQIPVQLDTRPIANALPPGNWLPGRLNERLMLDITDVPTGVYQLMMGLYNPVGFERLAPSTHDDNNQIMLGEVEIK